MSSAHRHKISSKYRGDLDLVFGDDIDIYGDAGAAVPWLNALSTVSKGAGEIAQQKADADKAAAQAKALKEAQDAATAARADAMVAQAKATMEADLAGPLHRDAAAKDAVAKVAEAKFAAVSGMPNLSAGGMPGAMAGKPSEHPWYFWPAIVGGVVVGGAVLYRLFSHSGSSSSSRYVKGA